MAAVCSAQPGTKGIDLIINDDHVASIISRTSRETAFKGFISTDGEPFESVVFSARAQSRASVVLDNVQWGHALARNESPTGQSINQAVNFGYDPRDGSAVLTGNGLDGLTTSRIVSVDSLFDPSKAPTPSGDFDQSTSGKFFKLSPQPNILKCGHRHLKPLSAQSEILS